MIFPNESMTKSAYIFKIFKYHFFIFFGFSIGSLLLGYNRTSEIFARHIVNLIPP